MGLYSILCAETILFDCLYAIATTSFLYVRRDQAVGSTHSAVCGLSLSFLHDSAQDAFLNGRASHTILIAQVKADSVKTLINNTGSNTLTKIVFNGLSVSFAFGDLVPSLILPSL